MHALTDTVWEVISWKSKFRYDTVCDQYTRIFMPKLFIVSSLIMGFSYFNDKLNCVVSDGLEISKEFVQETCWIQGFYIYNEMHDRGDQSSYYGIPEGIEKDGILESGRLCSTTDKDSYDGECIPMVQRYFLHYQWAPFYVCSLAILYCFPYLIFKLVNSDIISLVDSIRTGVTRDADKIANNYFNYRINSKIKMKLLILFNMFVKVVFVLVNVSGFALTDVVMDGRLLKYGVSWLKWNNYSDIPNKRSEHLKPKPGEVFLPSVGICDIHEAWADNRDRRNNKHRVICEISQNIRYQYIFIILWFSFCIGVLISIAGLLQSIFMAAKSLFWVYRPKFSGKKRSLLCCLNAQLTLREMEYLDKIKSADLALYGEILRELTRFKLGLDTSKRYSTTNGEIFAYCKPQCLKLKECLNV